MPIRAGRVFLVLTCVLLVASLAWIGVVWSLADPRPSAFIAPSLIGFIALVCLIIGVLMFSPFVEVSVGETHITVRRVVGAGRSVPLTEIDEVVLLRCLMLPARSGPSSTPRVVLRHGGQTVLAFAPRELGVVEKLASRGLRSTVISEPLRPLEASRRYRGAVSVGELVGGPLLWAALAVAVAVIAWALWNVLR